MDGKTNKREIIQRLKEHYGYQTNSELANKLGVAQNTISGWIKRNSIDYDLIFSKCNDIDFNWLMSGKPIRHESYQNREDIEIDKEFEQQTGIVIKSQVFTEAKAEKILLEYLHKFYGLKNYSADSIYMDIESIFDIIAENDLTKLFSAVYLRYKKDGDIKLLNQSFNILYTKCKEIYSVISPYKEVLNELCEKLTLSISSEFKAILDKCEEEDLKSFFENIRKERGSVND